VDTLTAAILVVTLLVLVAPIIEIAVKRPKTFLEMIAGMRAFAEAPLDETAVMRPSADVREAADAPVDHSGSLENKRRLKVPVALARP
jgi:hypothetical protein